jgi:pyruvate dehydrogenase E2 component (dihydrolipoamide acetyltransferase)
MATEVVMPKLGATMEEGTIVAWLVQIGEMVEEGDPVAEIQTDKIVLEIEAETTGVLLKKMYDEGSVVKVQEVVAYLGEEGESVEGLETQSSSTTSQPTEEQNLTLTEVATSIEVSVEAGNKIRRTPAARKLAEVNQIDLRNIKGSGRLGRIQKIDVESYLANNTKKITPLAKKIAGDQGIDYKNIEGTGVNRKILKNDLVLTQSTSEQDKQIITNQSEKRVPLKGMRKIIADRMSQSAYTAPHVTLTSEVDMTNCVSLRKDLLPSIEKINGYRLSFNDLIVKATAFTLQHYPDINVSLQENEIIYHSDVNVGFAVSVQDGLLVPVVKHANKMGLAAITEECKKLSRLAREGKLLPQHMQNGTFTISNLGMYAVDAFTPIINQPESAILGVGRIQERPVAYQGEITLRSMMTVSLSFDHRIIDGAPAAEFLTGLKETLENPFKLMI